MGNKKGEKKYGKRNHSYQKGFLPIHKDVLEQWETVTKVTKV